MSASGASGWGCRILPTGEGRLACGTVGYGRLLEPEVYSRAKGVPLGQGRTLMYFCPHCLKVLGFAQGRMI